MLDFCRTKQFRRMPWQVFSAACKTTQNRAEGHCSTNSVATIKKKGQWQFSPASRHSGQTRCSTSALGGLMACAVSPKEITLDNGLFGGFTDKVGIYDWESQTPVTHRKPVKHRSPSPKVHKPPLFLGWAVLLQKHWNEITLWCNMMQLCQKHVKTNAGL